MNPWNLAIGNLQPASAMPLPAAAADTKPPAPAERKKVAKAFCPHCGQRMRSPDGPKPWTPEEDATLRARISQSVKPAAIAAELGRPLSSIHSRINTLGLRRSTRHGN